MEDTLKEQTDKIKVGEEIITVIYEDSHKRVEKIISNGYSSPADSWYDQEETETVSIAQGFATLEFEDYFKDLKQGDTLVILPHQRHRVHATSTNPPCIWDCTFIW